MFIDARALAAGSCSYLRHVECKRGTGRQHGPGVIGDVGPRLVINYSRITAAGIVTAASLDKNTEGIRFKTHQSSTGGYIKRIITWPVLYGHRSALANVKGPAYGISVVAVERVIITHGKGAHDKSGGVGGHGALCIQSHRKRNDKEG